VRVTGAVTSPFEVVTCPSAFRLHLMKDLFVVALLRPDEHVFAVMLDRWRAQ
jgi:hypothetical protein